MRKALENLARMGSSRKAARSRKACSPALEAAGTERHPERRCPVGRGPQGRVEGRTGKDQAEGGSDKGREGLGERSSRAGYL